MSLKKYFEITEDIKSLSGKTAEEIGSQVESAEYHVQDIIERYIPVRNPERMHGGERLVHIPVRVNMAINV